MTTRSLTPREKVLAESIFGSAIDYSAVLIHNRKYWPFHPRKITMAPDGAIWFHPYSELFCPDFCESPLHIQGLFIHEMTHVWQAQRSGRWWLPLMRHPFCQYDYQLEMGKDFSRYGIEQQAEIVRHMFLLRQGGKSPAKSSLAVYEALVRFSR